MNKFFISLCLLISLLSPINSQSLPISDLSSTFSAWLYTSDSSVVSTFINCPTQLTFFQSAEVEHTYTFSIVSGTFNFVRIDLKLWAIDLTTLTGDLITIFINNIKQRGVTYSNLYVTKSSTNCVGANSDWSSVITFYYPVTTGSNSLTLKLSPVSSPTTKFGVSDITIAGASASSLPYPGFVNFYKTQSNREWSLGDGTNFATGCSSSALYLTSVWSAYRIYNLYIPSYYVGVGVMFRIISASTPSSKSLTMLLNGNAYTVNENSFLTMASDPCLGIKRGYNYSNFLSLSPGLKWVNLTLTTTQTLGLYVQRIQLVGITDLAPVTPFPSLPITEIDLITVVGYKDSLGVSVSASNFGTAKYYAPVPKKGLVAKTYYITSTTGAVMIQFELAGFGVSSAARCFADVYINEVKEFSFSDSSGFALIGSDCFLTGAIFVVTDVGNTAFTFKVVDGITAGSYTGLGLRNVRITAVGEDYLTKVTHTGNMIDLNSLYNGGGSGGTSYNTGYIGDTGIRYSVHPNIGPILGGIFGFFFFTFILVAIKKIKMKGASSVTGTNPLRLPQLGQMNVVNQDSSILNTSQNQSTLYNQTQHTEPSSLDLFPNSSHSGYNSNQGFSNHNSFNLPNYAGEPTISSHMMGNQNIMGPGNMMGQPFGHQGFQGGNNFMPSTMGNQGFGQMGMNQMQPNQLMAPQQQMMGQQPGSQIVLKLVK